MANPNVPAAGQQWRSRLRKRAGNTFTIVTIKDSVAVCIYDKSNRKSEIRLSHFSKHAKRYERVP